jgi:glucosylceramidase
MSEFSRRGFLKIASATAAASAVWDNIPAWAEGPHAGPVQVWSTFRDRRHEPADSLAWKPVVQVSPGAIVLSPSATRQQILGLGAALTDASCYLLSQIPADDRAALMHELFDPGEMALNVCRTCIGSSDYSRSVYSFDDSDQADPELKKFSIDHDKAYILPVLRDARKLNPELFLFSSPWSPPGWMKFNRSMLGGTIHKTALEPYSRYILKFLDAYKAEGVAIDAITIQNEVDTTVDGRYPACQWSQEDEILFVRKFLGPLMRSAGCSTKIWILDHNFNLWGRAIGELSNAAAYPFIDGIAWHGYAGEPSAMTEVHDAFPEKHAYFTEGGPLRDPDSADTSGSNPQARSARWAAWANSVFRNWARSLTVWNLALDENGTPYIGHPDPDDPPNGPASGIITVDSSTRKITRNARFWAMAHYSKHVRRGAMVFRTDGVADSVPDPAISHVGFRNPDGSMIVVLTNGGQERRVQLIVGSNALDVELPADSVLTLQWS